MKLTDGSQGNQMGRGWLRAGIGAMVTLNVLPREKSMSPNPPFISSQLSKGTWRRRFPRSLRKARARGRRSVHLYVGWALRVVLKCLYFEGSQDDVAL